MLYKICEANYFHFSQTSREIFWLIIIWALQYLDVETGYGSKHWIETHTMKKTIKEKQRIESEQHKKKTFGKCPISTEGLHPKAIF